MDFPPPYSVPPHAKRQMDPSPGQSNRKPGGALFFLWMLLLAAGAGALTGYDFKGSVPEEGATAWPENPMLNLDKDRPTLLLFIHPRCPCTAASIAQLDRVLSRTRFKTCVVVVHPPGAPEHWDTSPVVEAARRLPGAMIVVDDQGLLAQHFGAAVSGTAMAYDTTGTRRFSGGITASRGHEGDSAGSLALTEIGAGRVARVDSAPVFGCSLLGNRSGASGASQS